MGIKPDLIEGLIKSSDKKTAAALELIKYELGLKIDYYGNQFKNHSENSKTDRLYYIKSSLIYILIFVFRKKKMDSKNILSNAASAWNQHIESEGFNVYSPPWSINRKLKGSFGSLFSFKKVMRVLEAFLWIRTRST